MIGLSEAEISDRIAEFQDLAGFDV
jgi:hypothetical protein